MTEGEERFWAVPQASWRELRRFGWVICLPLWAVAGYLSWQGRPVAALQVCAVTVVLVGLGRVVPGALRPLYIVWMYLARGLGWVNTHLLLGLVFYTLFTVMGLGMRLFGRDPLQRRFDRQAGSYWRRREEPLPPAKHFERQF
ncbi:MAG: SxtJ family membrane protein [Candidatus Latescibacterota bacterium]